MVQIFQPQPEERTIATMAEPSTNQLPRTANRSPQTNLIDDLANYQRCWEEIHQRTLRQIQMVKGKQAPLLNMRGESEGTKKSKTLTNGWVTNLQKRRKVSLRQNPMSYTFLPTPSPKCDPVSLSPSNLTKKQGEKLKCDTKNHANETILSPF